MHLFNKYCSALGANSCIKLLVFLDFYTFFAFFCPILGKFGKISVWFDYKENTFACQVIYTFFYKFFLKMFYFSLLRCFFIFYTHTYAKNICYAKWQGKTSPLCGSRESEAFFGFPLFAQQNGTLQRVLFRSAP